jgi:hypothetical protein
LTKVQAKATDTNEIFSGEEAILYGNNFTKSGLSVYMLVNGTKNYFEYRFLNSGSLALSAPSSGEIPNGNYNLYVEVGNLISNTILVTYKNTTIAPTYTLITRMSDTGLGTVAVSPNKTSYNANEQVTVTAVPSSGYKFSGWKEDRLSPCTTTSSTCTFKINSNTEIQAVFVPTLSTSVNIYTLTVSKNGTGLGTVSGNNGSYVKGTNATLTATPATGSIFAGWSGADGACSGTPTTCIVTMNSNKTITATFNLVPLRSATAPSFIASDQSSYTTMGIDLELGMAHPTVTALQKFLNSNGYIIETIPGEPGSIGYESNYFGEKTKQALIKYQKDKGISPAWGFYGPQTRRMMGI